MGSFNNKIENLKLVSQHYRVWSMDVLAGLALYWWQRHIFFVTSRIRVNKTQENFMFILQCFSDFNYAL